MDLLTLKGDTPTRYARVLMKHIFSLEEMACSRYVAKRCVKPSLDASKRQLLEGTLYYRILDGVCTCIVGNFQGHTSVCM